MPVQQKTSKNALHYQNWGGWFIDPELYPGAFALLPKWRQAEINYRKAEHAAGRTPTFEGMVAAGNAAREPEPEKPWAAWPIDQFDHDGLMGTLERGARLLDSLVVL